MCIRDRARAADETERAAPWPPSSASACARPLRMAAVPGRELVHRRVLEPVGEDLLVAGERRLAVVRRIELADAGRFHRGAGGEAADGRRGRHHLYGIGDL